MTYVGAPPAGSYVPPDVIPDPPPDPDPGAVAHIGPSASSSTMEALVADMDYDVIEMEGGDYDWKQVNLSVDRTARPLTIRPESGATLRFIGDDVPDFGTWQIWELNSPAAYITIDGLGEDRMVYTGFQIGKCGIFHPWGTDHVTIRNQTFDGVVRIHTYEFPPGTPITVQPYHAWAFYMKNANDDLVIEDIWAKAPDESKGISFAQIESGAASSNITIQRVHELDDYYYAFFAVEDTSGLILDDWTMTDVGSGARSIWLTGSVNISGSYSNIVATGSDPLDDEHSGGGTFADGGGNSGI